jgi:nitroreductase
MEVMEAILKRRSIRKYQDRAIPESVIREIINAARLAPSGHNVQPWRFFIIKDSETKKKLQMEKIFLQDFVCKSPLIIVCCADPEVYGKESTQDDPNKQRALRDLCIASSFRVLRATELGLGTCYVGWVDKEKIKSVLNIPKGFVIPFVIIAGYPAEQPKPTPRKTIDEIVLREI